MSLEVFGDDGDDGPRHMRRVHGIPQLCVPRKGTGKRRSRAMTAVGGKATCRWCDGSGKW